MNWTEKHIKGLLSSGKIRGYQMPAVNTRKKKSKYRNKKNTVDGIEFDSKKEATRYGQLKIMEKAGKISQLKLQKEYQLTSNGKKVASYFADFVYRDINGKTIVEDVKSDVTKKLPIYRLKKKLMKICFDITIVEV